ncbi:MAG: polysaccharide biosynthesis/export family protein [Deltaproteobacteria bacterium]|nr:polysaccharide biosynthesis/export family protein [Deltaproteobacteria bacterium]
MKKLLLTILGLLFLFGSLPAAAATTAAAGYRIGPGDVLEISVWKDESLTRQLVVPPDGVISFPLVEDIKVTEMTVPQLRREITKRLSDFVPDATVTVMLMQVNSLQAYVIGKVNKPGQFPINQDTTVMQVLAMAGGLNPFAAPGKIFVLRRQGGKTVTLPFNYAEVVKRKNLEQNIVLRRGDVIVVP